jgi:hypothetical protein
MSTRVRVKYVPNHADFGAFMLSEQARKPAVEAAYDMVNALSGIVHRSSRVGGVHLADTYEVNEHPEPVIINGSPRAGADIYSSHPGAAPDEFGGKNQTAKHWMADVAAAWHVPKQRRGKK